ncbi:MAG TPA: zinc dependent phospholipase C family protein [Longimicrobiales bacterium]
MRTLITAAAALALLLLLPDDAWAFGPATHVFLGEQLLSNLSYLPPLVAELLRAYPQSFLYGSLAADISLAKKYVPVGRHCHYWHVGEEIYDEAANDRQRAVALGYLSHLAADTIAHNFFVPRQLLLTRSTRALGHSYWEHRMDAHLGERFASLARSIVMDYDHTEADALFDSVLSGTIFSFETNRRIFRGMIRVQDNDRWKAAFDRVVQHSRWDLSDEDVELYLAHAFDSIVDYLCRRRASLPAALDPTGEVNLQLAKRVRRMAIREGAFREASRLAELADDFFPLPLTELCYWRDRKPALTDA